ncbi:MAG: hypothetical protein GHCLOJNM_00931 [bacterium]|nr:hypothetical protein [bacterium]
MKTFKMTPARLIPLALAALLVGVPGAWSQCADGEYNGSYKDPQIPDRNPHIGFRVEQDGTVVAQVLVDILGCDANIAVPNAAGTGATSPGSISIQVSRADGVSLAFIGSCSGERYEGTWTGMLPLPGATGETCTAMGAWSAARTPTGDDDDDDDGGGGGGDDDGGAGDDDGDDDDGTGGGGDDDDSQADSRAKSRASSGASNPVVETPLGIDFDINPSFFDRAALEAMARIDPDRIAAIATMRLVWSNNRIRKEILERVKEEVEENLKMEVGGNRPVPESSRRPWRMVERMRTWKRGLSSGEVLELGQGRQEIKIDLANEDRNWNFSRGRSIQVESDPILVSQAHQTAPPPRKLFNRGVKQGIVQ